MRKMIKLKNATIWMYLKSVLGYADMLGVTWKGMYFNSQFLASLIIAIFFICGKAVKYICMFH